MTLARWALVGGLAAAVVLAAAVAVLAVVQAADEHDRIVSAQLDER